MKEADAMTDSCVAHTDIIQSGEAGTFLGSQISRALGSEPADALIVFASPKYDYSELLRSIESACRPKILVGCSSAGEFATGTQAEGSASAVAIRSSEMLFTAGVGRGLRANPTAAAKAAVSSFHGPEM